MFPADKPASIIFAFIAVLCYAGSVVAEVEATRRGNVLYGVFASVLFTLGVTFTYETISLWTRWFPTLSQATDLAYIGAPVIWLSVYGVIMGTCGALSVHFTRTPGHWHWSTPLIGMAAFGAGSAITVLTGWLPTP